MPSFILFRGSKRQAVRGEDLETSKIARIFQVSAASMYLSDDNNTAVFPDGHGRFPVDDMAFGSHFEVNGDALNTTPSAAFGPSTSQIVAGPQHPQPPPQTPTGRFAFAERTPPNPIQTAPLFRRPQNKTFQRSVQLVEAQGSTLHPVQTVYLRLTNIEANVPAVSEKVQESHDSEGPVILCDSKGMEINDVPGTTGTDFWKSQTRKVFCMTESAYREYIAGRRNKQREDIDHLEEARDLLATVLEQTRSVKRKMDTLQNTFLTGQVHVSVSGEQARAIKDAFMCSICKGAMVQPMYATCCKTLIGCQQCIETWYARPMPSLCPKCRHPDGQASTTLAAGGLTDAISALSALFQQE